jgi:MoxR-like ATPase
LQAMQEVEVSIGRRTYPLKPPFFVVATQNPIEMEGTYPLPEAQLDRFMFNLKVNYPTIAEERLIVKGTTGTHTGAAHAVLQAEEVLRLQDLVRGVPIADAVVDYAVRLAAATRPGESRLIDGLHTYITYGASPRASQYLVLGAKARAVLAGKYHVDFDDVKALAGPVLRHRLVLNFHARADGVDADTLVRRLLETVKQEA